MTRDWYDEFHSAYARNLGRIVNGQTLDIGDAERGIPERTVTIERILNVTVGVDSSGIFAALNVADTDGGEWALYTDGTIADYETDTTVGKHGLRTMPIVSEQVPS